MNEYLKQYIELQKQFRETKGKADSKGLIFRMFRQSEKIRNAENPDKSMVFGV